MATSGDIGLSQPAASTITMKLRTVTQDVNSTVVHQEVMTIGGAESTLQIAQVLAAAPGSTTFGLVVRGAGTFTVVQSTATDLLARVNQGVGNSSVGDRWRVNAANSSAQDYLAVRLVDSSGTGFLTPGNEYTAASTYSSFAGPTLTYDNSSNNTYRAVGLSTPFPVQLRAGAMTFGSVYSTVVSTASTAFYELVSSVAGVTRCVYAERATSTAVSPILIEYKQSTGTTVWHSEVGSGSSGVTGGNMAVSAPSRLFQSSVAGNVMVRLASTGVEVKFSLAYFNE